MSYGSRGNRENAVEVERGFIISTLALSDELSSARFPILKVPESLQTASPAEEKVF